MVATAIRRNATPSLNVNAQGLILRFDMTHTKTPLFIRLAAVLVLWLAIHPLLAADAAPNPPAAGPPDAQAQPGGARRGGRAGGRITPEEQAAIAKLGELPAWKPGAGDGDYSLAPPFSPAPENAPRENVPKGKVVSFKMD